MKKEKKPFDPIYLEVILCVFGPLLLNLLILFALQVQPENCIGTDGLLAVRRHLIWYLVGRFAAFIAPAAIVLLSGFFVHLFRREPLRPSKERLKTAGTLFLYCFFFFLLIPFRSGFEVQAKKNGYSGTRTMQAIALLADINKDLQEETVLPAENYYLDFEREDHGYTIPARRGGKRSHTTIWEYMLRDTEAGTTFAQISKSEYENAKESLCRYTAHEIAFYPNSGLIASFDGGTAMDSLNDFETLFTLTLAGNTVSRTVHPREDEFRQLTMVIERGGERIGSINFKNTTEQWFSLNMDTTVYLTMLYNGETVRVSNALHF